MVKSISIYIIQLKHIETMTQYQWPPWSFARSSLHHFPHLRPASKSWHPPAGGAPQRYVEVPTKSSFATI